MNRTLWVMVCIVVSAVLVEGLIIATTGGGSNNATTPSRPGQR